MNCLILVSIWEMSILFCVLLGENHLTTLLWCNRSKSKFLKYCVLYFEVQCDCWSYVREEFSDVEWVFNKMNTNIQWQHSLPMWTARHNVCLKFQFSFFCLHEIWHGLQSTSSKQNISVAEKPVRRVSTLVWKSVQSMKENPVFAYEEKNWHWLI